MHKPTKRQPLSFKRLANVIVRHGLKIIAIVNSIENSILLALWFFVNNVNDIPSRCYVETRILRYRSPWFVSISLTRYYSFR